MLEQDRKLLPRYRELAEMLAAQIRAGVIRTGQTLPGELELVQRHGVSRHTVREALRLLDELGLIERRRGVGTVVRSRQARLSYVQAVRSPAELLRYPPDSRLVVRSAAPIRAGRQLARLLRCAAGARWFKVGALRRLGSSRLPICWHDVYLLPEYAGVVGLIGRRGQSVYELVEKRYGERVAEVRVDLRAGSIAPELAGELATSSGAPSLSVIRWFAGSSGRVFQVSVSEHPAERYTYSLELRRGWQSGGGWSSE